MVRADYGYRVHTSMITFAGAARSVDYKIKKLPSKSERRSARAALTHLLQSDDSEYAVFYEKHQEFLRRHGKDAEEKLRKRPLRFIEQEGVEFRTKTYVKEFTFKYPKSNSYCFEDKTWRHHRLRDCCVVDLC